MIINTSLKWIDLGYVELYAAHTWKTDTFLNFFHFEIINYSENRFYLYLDVRLPDHLPTTVLESYGAYDSFHNAIGRANEVLEAMSKELKTLI